MVLRNPELTYEMAKDWYRNTPYCLTAMRQLKGRYPNMRFIGYRRLTPYLEDGVMVSCVDNDADDEDIERTIREAVPFYTLEAGDVGDIPICFDKVDDMPTEEDDDAFEITELING